MTAYLNPKFSVHTPGTQQYRDNWDAIFGKKEESARECPGCNEMWRRCPPPTDAPKSDIRKQVEEFHRVMGQPVLDTPQIPSKGRLDFRLRLIAEEFFELLEASGVRSGGAAAIFEDVKLAIEFRNHDAADLVGIVDALADLDFVNEGCRLECGVNGLPIANEVDRSNLSKLGEDGKPIYNADGKVIKGPNYSPPDIEWALRNQGWGGYDE